MESTDDGRMLLPNDYSPFEDPGATQGSIRVTVSQMERRSLLHMMWERKNTGDYLKAMENRVKSLQFAEVKAEKKLGDAKRLVTQRMSLLQSKLQEEERQQKAKAALISDVEAAHRRISQQREEMKAKIYARKTYVTRVKRGMAARLRNMEKAKLEALQVRIEEERDRKALMRIAIKTSLGSRARTQSQGTPHNPKVYKRKEEERRLKLEMDQRIHELQLYEKVLLQSVRDKYESQTEELQRLEEIITKPRETYRRLSAVI